MAEDTASIISSRASGLPLRERQFQFQQERAEETDNLRLLQEQRANAVAEKTLTVEATKLRLAAQQDMDAADFLKQFQAVRSTDPEFENKVAVLSATYPAALRDEAVQQTLGVTHARRKDYLTAVNEGGANAFPEGPARNTFQSVLKETGDINSAKAAAKTTAEGEKAVREFVKDGFLTQADFATDPNKPLPPIYKPNGEIDYAKAQDLGAQRKGKVAGAAAKAEDADLRLAQSYVTSWLTNRTGMLNDDPNAGELYKTYAKKLLDAAKGPPAAAPAASTKPAVVKQNGVSYTLQPDGTYK